MIQAPIETCFRVSLSIDLELRAAQEYGIRAVKGVTTGIIDYGERVTWQVRQFGIWVEHTTEITGFSKPDYFQDSMVSGLFHSFSHDHFFRPLAVDATEMRDVMNFSMPLLLGGPIFERIVVKRRLASILSKRNDAIQKEAEGIAS